MAKLNDPIPMRPRTRGECMNGPRPCPWVSCRHSFVIDEVVPVTSLRRNANTIKLLGGRATLRGDRPPMPGEVEAFADAGAELALDLEYPCALDVVDAEGEQTVAEVAQHLGISDDQVRRDEARAIAKIRAMTPEQRAIYGYLADVVLAMSPSE